MTDEDKQFDRYVDNVLLPDISLREKLDGKNEKDNGKGSRQIYREITKKSSTSILTEYNEKGCTLPFSST